MTRRWLAFTASRVALDAADEVRAIADFFGQLAEELAVGEAARAQGLRIGLLTNNSASLSPTRMLHASGLGALVDVALSAQMIGARKPEPEAYRAVAGALEVPARSCIYFDDAIERVAGARAVGMRASLVDPKRARHDLAAGIVADLGAL